MKILCKNTELLIEDLNKEATCEKLHLLDSICKSLKFPEYECPDVLYIFSSEYPIRLIRQPQQCYLNKYKAFAFIEQNTLNVDLSYRGNFYKKSLYQDKYYPKDNIFLLLKVSLPYFFQKESSTLQEFLRNYVSELFLLYIKSIKNINVDFFQNSSGELFLNNLKVSSADTISECPNENNINIYIFFTFFCKNIDPGDLDFQKKFTRKSTYSCLNNFFEIDILDLKNFLYKSLSTFLNSLNLTD